MPLRLESGQFGSTFFINIVADQSLPDGTIFETFIRGLVNSTNVPGVAPADFVGVVENGWPLLLRGSTQRGLRSGGPAARAPAWIRRSRSRAALPSMGTTNRKASSLRRDRGT